MRNYFIILSLFFVLLAGLVLPTTTRAEATRESTAWGIVPVPDENPATTANGYFIYLMQPDAQVSGQVLLRNPGTTPVTIDLTTVNSETAQQGGSAFSTEDGAASGVAGWITLSQRQATLQPGTEQAVPFSVRTPTDVKPGQYLAGIAASEAPVAVAATAAKPALGAGVTMRSRYVIGVEADIGSGWTPGLSIPAVSVLDQPSGTVIGVDLNNDGTMFIKPSGTIMVTDAANKQLLSQKIDMGTFVPGTGVTYPISWPGQPVAGTYTVAVKLDYADGKTATYNDTITVSGEVVQHAAEQAAAAANAPAIVPAAAPAVAPAAASPIQPWMIYMLAAFFLLIILLLVLNLLRGRAKQQSS